MKIITYTYMLLTLTLLPHAAHGFGKNKVQYRYMHWEYMQAQYYTLYYHQEQGPLPEIAYIWLDDIYRNLSERFKYMHRHRVPIVLYESPALFEQTNIITQILPEEVGGFTEVFKNRIAMPFNGCYNDLRHILHHEMLHAFVFGITHGGSIFNMASAQIPLWFNEGLAEVLSTGWTRDADMYMLDRILHGNMPLPGPMLSDGYIAYKGGQSFLYYLYNIGGERLFNRMLQTFSESKHAEKSIEAIYKKSLEGLGKDWLNELRRIYWPEIGQRIMPADHADRVTDNSRDRSRFNLRPRISPNGQLIAFFSDRHTYARIIITDTSGKTVRKIGQHRLSGSFESFQPFSGAIAWSPDSREIAFVAKKGGRNDIRIVDAQTGGLRKTIEIPTLSAITGLDWSRDGERMAVTAIANGQTNLHIYNINTQELLQLTHSPGTTASPRFSPNGQKIIFTITDTAGLRADPLKSPEAQAASNIALYDFDSGSYSLLTTTKWNDIQPSFSPDGRHFVFVSDRNGINNIYIANMDNPNNAHPLTDYTGGCGNPDWAADGSAIVYDNFLGQAWNVWRMTDPLKKIMTDSTLVKTKWAQYEEGITTEFFRRRGDGNKNVNISDKIITANTMNTADKIDTAGTASIADTTETAMKLSVKSAKIAAANYTNTTGNIDTGNINVDNDTSIVSDSNTNDDNWQQDAASAFLDTIPATHTYTLRFTPDFLIFGLGINTYYGTSGQVLAAFSDIMGDHRIVLVGDLQMDFSEYAQIYAAYQYLKLRTNLTVGGFYHKYYSYAYDGHAHHLSHDREAGGFMGADYPFSRFSRVEAQISGRHILRKPLPEGENPFESNALLALFSGTFDNILWGITGPLAGFRSRAQLHIAPTLDFTDEAYLSADIDLRSYTHILRRFVWANRVTAGGTIGLGGKNAARRFFLGGDDNWFNYDLNRENYRDNINEYSYYSNIVTPLRGWNYFDMVGDRMLLMNSEFRFPFIREISTAWPLPMRLRYITGAVFIDAGYAWTRDKQNSFIPIPPEIMGGYGFGMRANLGIFVLRYDRGWPTDFRQTGGPTNYYSLGAEF